MTTKHKSYKFCWHDAVVYMEKGGLITRKSWLTHDFMYMKDGVLFCDGNYEYLAYMRNTSGTWINNKLEESGRGIKI